MITTEELEDRLAFANRVDGPAILFDAWFGNEIDSGTLAAVIGDVWCAAEYPEQAITDGGWQHMFGVAGYTEDGVSMAPPSEIRLYRGAPPEFKSGMSWSSDIEVAKKFATGGLRGRKPGRLYTTVAGGDSLLAFISDRQEHEYVVDTEGLEIEEVSL